MFKVNFKPLWPEAIGALALLSERFPAEVWAICSRQLLTAATRDSSLYISRKPEWSEPARDRGDDIVFEEQQLRCHHLEELRQVVAREVTLFQGGVEATNAREAVLAAVRLHLFLNRSWNCTDDDGDRSKLHPSDS
jgi:U3 small nucleolar RNA-associated protein 20